MKVPKADQFAESTSSIDTLCCYVIVSERHVDTNTSMRGATEVKHQGCYFVQYAAWSKLSNTSGQQVGGLVINKGQP